jgi:carboxyl-terminal processing protease
MNLLNKRYITFLMIISFLLGVGCTYVGLEHKIESLKKNEENTAINEHEAEKIEKESEKLLQAYELITARYYNDVDASELVDGAIQGMVKKLNDPYSFYMDNELSNLFSESQGSSIEGIGAEVSMINSKVTIVAPIKNSPVERAGLKPGDQIISIDGESVEGLDLNEVIKKISGKKGTTVRLGILRPGTNEVLKFKVTREEIPIKTVQASIKDFKGKKVGYIEIATFTEKTAEDFSKVLKQLEEKGIDGLVIDVRGNPGGFLQSVEDILKQFITKEKPYVQLVDRNGHKQKFFTTLKEEKKYPISVLIDRGSASASEILAAALKEAGGYEIVGEKSFGKGTIQQALPLSDGSNIKLTQYKWLTPDGNWINEKGVEPTVEVLQPEFYYTNPIHVQKVLSVNMKNDHIQNAQIKLKGLGFNPGRTDGYFSIETENAVKLFQKANNLPVTGKINNITAQMIEKKVLEQIRNPKNDVQLQTAMKVLFQ